MAERQSPVPPTPVREQVAAAASTALEEVLTKATLDALMGARPDNLIAPKDDPEARRANANRSGGWLHAPAHLELFAAADRRLTRIAGHGEVSRHKVERVHCRLVPGTKLLIIKPASANDLTAMPVSRYAKKSSAWINLASLLEGAGLALATGFRERYDAAYIPSASPLAPGLVIDLSHPLERRQQHAKRASSKPADKKAESTKPVEPAQPVASTQN